MRCTTVFDVVLLTGEIPTTLQVMGEGVGPHEARVDAERRVQDILNSRRHEGTRLWSMQKASSTYDAGLATHPLQKPWLIRLGQAARRIFV